jgi:molybdate/tungstate transport system permease protein
LLSIMGLCATIREPKLLAYFLALVFSFTFCQPYAWEAALVSFFFLKMMFSIRSGTFSSRTAVIFLGCGAALVFLVLLPVLVIIMQEDPRNIINILKMADIRRAIYLTLVTATLSSIILALFCIPLAYAVSRLQFRGKNLLLSFIDIPIVIPQSAAGLALLAVFSKQQILGGVLFTVFGLRFDGTVLGICLAQVFVAMPFLMKSGLAAFDSVQVMYEQASRTLGASSFSAFWRIALPLASRGIFIGFVLAWARAAGEFGAVLFIAPYPVTAPVAVYNRFTSVGVVQAAPLVAALLLFSLVMFFFLQLASRMIPAAYKTES